MSPLDPRARAMQGAMRGTSLADIFGTPAPPPVAVSPASPAPMRPGVQIQAPQRPVLSPRAVAPAAQAVGDAAEADMFGALYDQMREKSQAALRTATTDTLAQAEADAKLDPQQEALYERQASRIAPERERIDREERGSEWDRLIDFGAALGASKSRSFAAALTEGLASSSRGYDERKAARVRQRALLEDREDQIATARYNALQAARSEARAKLVQNIGVTKDLVQLAAMSDEAVVKKATAGSVVRKAAAESIKAEAEAQFAGQGEQADIAYKLAAAEAARASATESRAGAEAYRSGQRGSGGRGRDGDGYDMEEVDKAGFDRDEALNRAATARQAWLVAPEKYSRGSKTKGELWAEYNGARRAALLAQNRWLKSQGKGPVTMEQFYSLPRNGSRTQRRTVTDAAPPPAADPLGIR